MNARIGLVLVYVVIASSAAGARDESLEEQLRSAAALLPDQPRAAAEAFSKLERQYPGCVECLLGLASAKNEMEIYSDAEKAAHKALALSTHPEQQRLAWSVLGTSYYNRTPMDASPGLLESNMTKAEEAFRRAHELDGGATESIRWNLASALEWLGREGEAADLFSDRGSPWRGGAAASESSSSGTTAPLFVQGEVRKPVVIERVQPVYSLRARHQRIEGAVILETIIGTDGRVADVRVLKGLRGLTMAAIRCLRQWRFEPARRDGEPVPVYFTVTVNFQLPPGAGARPPG